MFVAFVYWVLPTRLCDVFYFINQSHRADNAFVRMGIKWSYSMKKLKYLLPTVALFVSPWMHKAIYNNLLMAWPNVDHDFAHAFGIIGAVVAFFVTILLSLP